ncbi:methionine-rich copper-binding protein CopC [Arthrobacter sp. CAN_A212]|uniref:copper resistance CopC family protein n=1 Tax=unclassified Arthrobacter TaxID=235627 RepID=UPI0018CA4684|nr:copper resistance CopC family protein [Arthrobacter sp. CAN_C5]MBP2218381.1 methionine-rich copper-binding protein CopC [Arthrobacter sp. CAN_C5]
MSSTNPRSTRTAAGHLFVRVPALLAAMLLVVLMTALGSASTANAHDELVGSNPEAGASVEQLPEAIELTFSSVPSGIGSEVEVLDETGGNWAEGDVAIVDRVASQPLRTGAPAGEYTVNWRVVSSDSHPIEGTFTVTAAAAGTAQSPSAAVGTQMPIEIEEAEQTVQNDFPWSIVVMVVVLIGLAVYLAVTARKRLRQGSDS